MFLVALHEKFDRSHDKSKLVCTSIKQHSYVANGEKLKKVEGWIYTELYICSSR